ncbi:MAG: hypothetical protein RRA94_08165 [Bacteroidota bacterium]|nr:hypothetical protein [Bacteroidota bacterium]
MARKKVNGGRSVRRTALLCCGMAVLISATFAREHIPTRPATETAAGTTGIRMLLPELWTADGLASRAVVTKFTGQREGRDVRLHWVTARESGNRGFEVQRASSLSRGWERLHFVPGFGSSTLEQNYQFTDRSAPPEDVRYMLRILGSDGMVQYSQIITVPAGSMLRSFTVQPLREDEEKIFRARIDLTEAGVTALSVIDQKGLTLLRVMAATQLEAGKHDFIVDCSKVPHGTYTLMLHIPEGRYSRLLNVP